MALQTKIKINNVQTLYDARYCAGMGVELIGFQIDKNQNTVPTEKIKEIMGWVAGVSFVGECSENPILDDLPFDFLQTNSPEFLPNAQQFGLPLILEIQTQNKTVSEIEYLLQNTKNLVQYFLLDCTANFLETHSSDLQTWCKNYPILIGLKNHTENVLKAWERFKPQGIALQASAEIKVGMNDLGDLSEILEKLAFEE